MNDFAQDQMAQRLATLEPRVDVDGLARRALASRPGRGIASRVRIGVVAIALPLAMLVSAALASYYAPTFAQALADAPVAGAITGPMLRGVGLAGVPYRVTTFGDTASAGGYRVELLGGYADAGRTVLFLRTQPAAIITFPRRPGQELTLSDQFGQSYRSSGGIANSETGENTIIFEPLRWPATLVGARLQMSFNTIEVRQPSVLGEVAGRWDLTGTLAPDEGADLALPPGGSIGEMRVEFTRLRSTPSAVLAEMRIQPSGLDLDRVVPDAGKGRNAFQVKLMDASGGERPMLQAGYGSAGTGIVEGRWIWLIDEPGRYELRISYEGIGDLRRSVEAR